jgi:hypothetical protein
VAECQWLEAVECRDRLAKSGAPNHLADAARTRQALTQHYLLTGRTDAALMTIAEAVALMERIAKPDANPRYEIELAEYLTTHAELLRQQRNFPAAEPRFVAAVTRAESVLGRKPAPDLARDARAVWVRAEAGRATLLNNMLRHREAAVEWAKLAKDDPDAGMRVRHEIFVLQSLTFAGDWRAAAAGADALAGRDLPPGGWCDLGRVWCFIWMQVQEDGALDAFTRHEELDRAVARAVCALHRAKKAGLFRDPAMVEMVLKGPHFVPVRGQFDPRD